MLTIIKIRFIKDDALRNKDDVIRNKDEAMGNEDDAIRKFRF